MDPFRLTGFVYPVKKKGVPVRGRFQLWVNLPPEPAFDKDGQPVLGAKANSGPLEAKTGQSCSMRAPAECGRACSFLQN